MNDLSIRGPITHELKCHPEPFQAVKRGDKPFEWRKDDRDYRVGDSLWLREWDPLTMWGHEHGLPRTFPLHYTGEELRCTVTYIIREGFGIPEGYCIMGLSRLEASAGEPVGDVDIETHALDLTEDAFLTVRKMSQEQLLDLAKNCIRKGMELRHRTRKDKPIAWMDARLNRFVSAEVRKNWETYPKDRADSYQFAALVDSYSTPLYAHPSPSPAPVDLAGVLEAGDRMMARIKNCAMNTTQELGDITCVSHPVNHWSQATSQFRK